MKPSLQLKLGQSLTLTPQLRMAIRLLQLSAIELELEINEAVDSNPLLEREGEDFDAAPAQTGKDETASQADGPEPERPQAEEFDPESGEEPEFRWEQDHAGSGSQGGDSDDREDTRAAPQDLRQHLNWQLQLSHLKPRDLRIGEALIEAIDEDGYLHAPFEDIQAALAPDLLVAASDIETVLKLIQHFDPVGVGARSLSECLGVQLGLLDPETPGLVLARTLAASHLEALAKQGAVKLAAQFKCSPQAMDEAVALLRSLDPRPGARIGGSEPEYIVPDAIAYRQNGVWKVATHHGSQPRISINRHYEGLIGKSTREDDSYLRSQLRR